MRMCIHKARDQHVLWSIDPFARREAQKSFLLRLDCDDAPLSNGNGMSFQHHARRLDRNDPPRCDQRVDVFHSLQIRPENKWCTRARKMDASIACEALLEFG